MAKYPHFARTIQYGPEVMRTHSNSSLIKGRIYVDFNRIGRTPMGPKIDNVTEHGLYNPNYFAGTNSAAKLIPFKKMIGRK